MSPVSARPGSRTTAAADTRRRRHPWRPTVRPARRHRRSRGSRRDRRQEVGAERPVEPELAGRDRVRRRAGQAAAEVEDRRAPPGARRAARRPRGGRRRRSAPSSPACADRQPTVHVQPPQRHPGVVERGAHDAGRDVEVGDAELPAPRARQRRSAGRGGRRAAPPRRSARQRRLAHRVGVDEEHAVADRRADRRRRLGRAVVDDALAGHPEPQRQPQLVRRDHLGADAVAVQAARARRGPGSSCTTRRCRRRRAASPRRRWHRGGRRARRGAGCHARAASSARSIPPLHSVPLAPTARPHVDSGRSVAAGLAAGDEGPTWSLAMRRPRRGEPTDHDGVPEPIRILQHLARPCPSTSVSTRNGRRNARGWRKWASSRTGSRAAGRASRTSPRRSARRSGPRRGRRSRRAAVRAANRTANPTYEPTASCQQLRPGRRRRHGTGDRSSRRRVVPEHREVVAERHVEAHLPEPPRVEVERARARPSPGRRAPRARTAVSRAPGGRPSTAASVNGGAARARTSCRRRGAAATALPCGLKPTAPSTRRAGRGTRRR